MTKMKFSSWVRWNDRNKIEGIKNPGVYAIAITSKDISTRNHQRLHFLKSFVCR